MANRKVLFEASPMLDKHKTGVGYYVEYLTRALADSGEIDLEGFYFDFFGRNRKKGPMLPHTRFRRIFLIPGKLLSLARRFGWQPPLEMFVRSRADITLFTNYVSLPVLKKTKVALVVYDLSYLDHPEFTQERNLAFLNTFCSDSIRKADLIITISDFTKQRIVSLFPNLSAEIIVTPIPPLPLKQYVKNDLILNNHNLTAQHYILYLGTIEPRKNIEKLIEGYALLPANIRSKYPLVLAGGKGWKDGAIRNTIELYRNRGYTIVTTGYISDEEKDSLYRNAVCYVLPSHYEGFGMPILEAMQYQLPVVVSDIPVFHEVAGDAAYYFNKDNAQSIADTLSRCLADSPQQAQRMKRQQAELNKYSWRQNADIVIDAFESLLS